MKFTLIEKRSKVDGSAAASPPRSPTGVQDVDNGRNMAKMAKQANARINSDRVSLRRQSDSARTLYSASLPSLDETSQTLSFEEGGSTLSGSYISDSSTLTSKKSKKTTKSKPSRLRKVQAMQKEATELAHTGEEEEALQLYQHAIQIAGSEIARINFKIRKAQGKHMATRESIQRRLREDLRKIAVIIGKLRTKMAILYERQGDYDHAIAACVEAREVYRAQPATKGTVKTGESPEELADLMELMIERLKFAQKALAGRSELLTKISALRNKIPATPYEDDQTRIYERIEMAADKVKRMEIAALGDSHPQVADTFQLLSTISLEQGKHDEAIKYLQKAIKISKSSLGMTHPRTGQLYLRLARIYLFQRSETLALECFHEATHVLQHSSRFARVLGSTFNDVGVIHMRRSEYDLAIGNLQEALQYYQNSSKYTNNEAGGIKNGGLSVDSLQVWRNLGECYMKLNESKKAKEAYMKVLELQQKARKVHDDVKDLNLGIIGVERLVLSLVDDESIADTLMRLGRAYAAGANHQVALDKFKDAMDILNRIGIEDELASGDPDTQRRVKKGLVTNTLYCIAEECSALGKYDEAINVYGESLRLRSCSSFTPEEMHSKILHCALCFVGIGNVQLKKKDYSGAHKMFAETLTYCEANGLSGGHSLAEMIRQQISDIERHLIAESSRRNNKVNELEKRAKEEIKKQEFGEARASLTQALALRRENLLKLNASGEDAAEEIHSIALLLRSFGSVFARGGDEENADRAYSDATRLFKKSGAYENIEL